MNARSILTATTAVGAGLLLAVAVPLSASAHISISPNASDPGSYQEVTFKALNESTTAATTKVEITLPTDTPIVSVSYQPTPGWTTEVVRSELPEPVTIADNTITEAPSSIVFTAQPGFEIQPGQFQRWTVSLGPIPETGSILFPGVQTYDNGDVVNWTETAEDVAADSSLKPAPVLFVEDEPTADTHGGGTHDEDEAAPATTNTTAAAADGGLPLGLSIAALVLGLIGAVLGAIALFGRENRTA